MGGTHAHLPLHRVSGRVSHSLLMEWVRGIIQRIRELEAKNYGKGDFLIGSSKVGTEVQVAR